MKLGILETGEVHPDLVGQHGSYPDMFARRLLPMADDLELAIVRVVAGEMPASPGQADAWLVTGSRHGVYDDLPWIAPLKAFLRDCVAEGVPVVGVCFGHQILAEALGGRAVKSDGGWRLGVEEYEVVTRPGWMEAIPDRFALLSVHQDQVVELPAGATVLAAAPGCPYAAIAYGDPDDPDAISVQPHPEFDVAFVDGLIGLRAGTTFAPDLATAARASLGRAIHTEDWARLILDYLELRTERVALRNGTRWPR